MANKVLTERSINALKPAETGKRYDRPDGIVPGLAVRVTDKGVRTFILTARYPGNQSPSKRKREHTGLNPTRREIAKVGEISLADARDRAREWLRLIKTGVDPMDIEEAQRQAEAEKRLTIEREKQNTFAAVVEIFLTEYVHGRNMRRAKHVETRVRNELVPHWKNKPVQSITRDDVEDLIGDIVNRPAPRYAHNVLDDTKMFFGWCVDVVKRDRPYKLTTSPCDRIKPAKLIGEKKVRTRVLDDAELRALWKACETIGYPYGRAVQLLLLVGCRLNEAARAQRREFNGAWIIPAERFKSGQQHPLPITEDIRALLDSLPEFKSGDYLFSTCYGKKPVNGFSKAKQRIDKLMPASMVPWTLHDIRRTVRSRLSALRVPDHVAEMVIGHGRKGLQRTYDQHRYESEIREALEAWQAKLRLIVNSTNVVSLPVRA
jgi:integrase